MIEFDAYKTKLNALRPKLDTVRDALKLDAAREEIAQLEAETGKDGFWNDVQNAQKVQQQIKRSLKGVQLI